MKATQFYLCILLLLNLWSLHASPSQLIGYETATIVEQGPHHRVIQRLAQYRTSYGKVIKKPSQYVELATGMHYWEDDQWKLSSNEIEIFEGTALTRKGPHKVIFAANLNSVGAIDLSAPDGQRFRSHILGLAYTDAASGQSVMIATVKDCIGAVLPPNQVYYLDAFEGDCQADVRYTYEIGSFEQDVIITQAPPSPAEWGLDPATTRLEAWTEFIEAPEPTVNSAVLKATADPLLRQAMFEPDLIDERLRFGSMSIASGRAFPLEQDDPFGDQSVPTGKSWESVEQRLFLIEKVDYQDVLAHLNTLPQTVAAPRNKLAPAGAPIQRMARVFPPVPKGTPGKWVPNQYAKLDPHRKGLVLDYVTLNSSQTNNVFSAEITYFITDQERRTPELGPGAKL